VYLTNAVKHFKWRPTGTKKRLHQHPNGGEIERCKPWLIAELDALQPRVVVALGAIAGQSLLGRRPAIGRERARIQPGLHALPVMVTYHPSAVLRADERQHADDIFAAMVSDLRDALAAARS
jgi:uracil-DNA glycosylase